jgi:hypothetical protein
MCGPTGIRETTNCTRHSLLRSPNAGLNCGELYLGEPGEVVCRQAAPLRVIRARAPNKRVPTSYGQDEL